MSDEEWEDNLNYLRKEKLQKEEMESDGEKDETSGEFGGEEKGSDEFGATEEETPPPAEEGGGEAEETSPEKELPVAPESVNAKFGKENEVDSEIFNSWIRDDKTIQKKKRNFKDLVSKNNKFNEII